MTRESFFEEMLPYAKRASAETGIPSSVILAQWAHESDYGQSWGARHRLNFGGISNFIGKPYSWSKAVKVEPRPSNEGAWYNVYRSIDGFVDDYVHVMNLSYYDGVRQAGATPGIEDDVLALAKSPYAGDHYGGTGSSLMKIIKKFDLSILDNEPSDLDDFKVMVRESKTALLDDNTGIVIMTGAVALALIALLDL